MSRGFSNPTVGGVGNLIRSWIQSVPFVSGSVGWRISRDGTAEFNGATFRGTVTITSSNDLLVYSTATPQTNKLIMAVAGSAGNDGLGNTWSAGLNIYNSTGLKIGAWSPGGFTLTNDVSPGQVIIQATNVGVKSPRIYYYSGAPGVSGVNGYIEAQNIPGNRDTILAAGPITAADTSQSYVYMSLKGSNPASPGQPSGTLTLVELGVSKDLLQWDNDGVHIYSGDITATMPGTSAPPIPETWHAVVPAAGFTLAGTVSPARYRMDADNCVRLDGQINTTGAIGAGSTLFTLPIGWQPTRRHDFVTQSSIAVGAGQDTVQINAGTGIVTCGQAFTGAGQLLFLDGITCPMD